MWIEMIVLVISEHIVRSRELAPNDKLIYCLHLLN
jgi:hypothetical protein